MRCESPGAIRRFLRKCNLLPNPVAAIVYERAVLRLVVSVANSWGILRRLSARPGRTVARPVANRRCSSSCLSDVILSWAMPAPAALPITLSTRSNELPRRAGFLKVQCRYCPSACPVRETRLS
jgi:hypothetical protein